MAFATIVAAAAPAAAQTPLGDAAAGFLATLSGDEHEQATWPFANPERLDIHYAPVDLDGLRHGGLEGGKYQAGEDLLALTLSSRGFAKVRAIRLLERDVRALEAGQSRPEGFRDPGRYLWAFFGTPATDAPWGYRYEGHHLSLNITAVPDRPAASLPLFLGAQPRKVPAGLPSAGVAALGKEEALARELYASLDDDQRDLATLPFKTGRGHMVGQVPTLTSPAPVGLPFPRMTAAQQEQLLALLREFATFWNEAIATERLAEIDAARDGLHFAFVAREDPPFSFYMRIQGQGVLLEIDNTAGGDHVHAVWHRPGDDFGQSLLAAHLRHHHGAVASK
ncbi:MAG: DUF3500 domain-containing protein [Gammaproteobacteria bacterium]|nr:DUF3500 domain-containing protein [Gammaproteobacteria bacterium]